MTDSRNPRPQQALRRPAGHRDVDFALQEGEMHCLIGPNGAGKSTLFRLILGEHPPSSGSIFYAGEDITALKPFQRIRARHERQVPGAGHLQGAERAAESGDRAAAPSGWRLAGPQEIGPAAGLPRSVGGRRAAGRQSQPRPEAMARDRHGDQPEAAPAAAGRADRRHVADETYATGEMVQALNARRHDRARGRARHGFRAADRAARHRAASRPDLRPGHDRGDRRRRARRSDLSGRRPMRKEVVLSTLEAARPATAASRCCKASTWT